MTRIAVPVLFTDGHGEWLVDLEVDGGTVPLCRVAQTDRDPERPDLGQVDMAPGAPETVTSAEAHLHFRSAPRPVVPPAEFVANDRLVAAVAAFSAAPGYPTLTPVLAALQTGEVLLDAGPVGSQPSISANALPDGTGALFAYSSQAAFDAHCGPDRAALVQPAAAVCDLVINGDPTVGLVIDPAGPTCRINDRELQFAVQGANRTLATALSPGHTLQHVFDALHDPEGSVLLGEETAARGKKQPLSIPGDPWPAYAIFTSMAEVAAGDQRWTAVGVNASTVVEWSYMNSHSLVINPGSDNLLLNHYQLWWFLARPLPPQEYM